MVTLLISLLTAMIFCLENNFHFAILGDRTGTADQEAFQKVVEDIQALMPDFVVTVGDLAEDGSNPDDWTVPMQTMNIINCPIYYTAGNHDILDDDSARLFTLNTGCQPFYSFRVQNSTFIILDNARASSYEDMDLEQRQWLEKTLAECPRDENKFVFMHKPFWAETIGAGREDTIHELFCEYNVNAVFTGHWHQYAYNIFDDIEYFIVGSSGGDFGSVDVDMGDFYQFMWCRVEESNLYTTLIRSGNFFPRDYVTLADLNFTRKINRELLTYECHEIESRVYEMIIKIINPHEEELVTPVILLGNNVWSVSPVKDSSIVVPAKDSLSCSFLLEQNSGFYPLPRLTCDYPVRPGKTYNFNNPILLSREIIIPETQIRPVIDGSLEEEWDSAPITEEFADDEADLQELTSLQLKFMYDKEFIFLSCVCPGEISVNECKAHNHDESVYYDESIGFLLAGEENIIYQYYINPDGIIWDMRTDLAEQEYNRDWNSQMQCSTKIDSGSWILEIAIPWAELGSSALEPLYFNLRRYDQRNERLALFIPEWSYRSVKYGILTCRN